MLTPQEYADVSGLNINAIYSSLAREKIPGAKKLGSRWLIPSMELQQLHSGKEDLEESITYLSSILKDEELRLKETKAESSHLLSQNSKVKSELTSLQSERSSEQIKLNQLTHDVKDNQGTLNQLRKQIEGFNKQYRINLASLLKDQASKIIHFIKNDASLHKIFKTALVKSATEVKESSIIVHSLSCILKQISETEITVLKNYRVLELLDLLDTKYKLFLKDANSTAICRDPNL
jgi:septal ring factor EnvC (AmiA/AmiB activator)